MSSWLQCDCPHRHAAQKLGQFFYMALFKGWVFDDGPFRAMSESARYFRFERDLEDHTGEPFVYHTCPWCGCDLPSPIVPTTNWDEGNG